jgi:DNA-binding transcriptional regulator GbsR (MarR family)
VQSQSVQTEADQKEQGDQSNTPQFIAAEEAFEQLNKVLERHLESAIDAMLAYYKNLGEICKEIEDEVSTAIADRIRNIASHVLAQTVQKIQCANDSWEGNLSNLKHIRVEISFASRDHQFDEVPLLPVVDRNPPEIAG